MPKERLIPKDRPPVEAMLWGCANLGCIGIIFPALLLVKKFADTKQKYTLWKKSHNATK